jgi:ubiquinone/menaquinone biosynthesis C-methylase UbiE
MTRRISRVADRRPSIAGTVMTQKVDASPSENDLWSQWVLKHRHAGDAEYQRIVQSMIERIRDRVLDGAQLCTGMTVADVGTGDGLIAFGAIARVGPSLRVVQTDVSTELLRHAECIAIELGFASQCSFIEGSAEKLAGIGDASLDVVITRAVLAYVPGRLAAFREFHRVLKPAGRISLAEPILRDQALETLALTQSLHASQPSGKAGFLHLLHRWKSAQFPSTEPEIAASPIASFSERDLVRLAREAGFVDIHLELHIDERTSSIKTWDVFLGVSPHPLAPPLKEILSTRFSEDERQLFEKVLRPIVESGKALENDAVAYLTASKPKL